MNRAPKRLERAAVVMLGINMVKRGHDIPVIADYPTDFDADGS
jgi:hypothetical protein